MKGIMAIKGHGRRFVLAGIDILTYIIITAIYLGIDYLFLNDAIGNVGEYIINSLILQADRFWVLRYRKPLPSPWAVFERLECSRWILRNSFMLME
jgi:hypothetical protein